MAFSLTSVAGFFTEFHQIWLNLDIHLTPNEIWPNFDWNLTNFFLLFRYMAFSLTSVASVMTNTALLAMDPEMKSLFPSFSESGWILAFVAIEHIFLAIRVIIDKVIPDQSRQVKFRMDRDDFILKSGKIGKMD